MSSFASLLIDTAQTLAGSEGSSIAEPPHVCNSR